MWYPSYMPALNIQFTDEELTLVRTRARDEGQAMHTYVHDAFLECIHDRDKSARVAAAFAEVVDRSSGVLRLLADM